MEPQNNDSHLPFLPPHRNQPQIHQAAAAPFTSLQMAKEARQLWTIAYPLIISGLLTYGKSAVSTFFSGWLGKQELAGGSLAIGFANITGYSILSGLAMGMDPIASQAFGAKQWALVGHTLNRTILILLSCCLPICLLWLNLDSILVALGQDPTITAISATYLTYCLPDLLFIALINPIKVYLRSQNLTRPLMVSAAVGLALHVPINYLFVVYLNLGIKGVAMSAAIMDLNILLVLVTYIILTGTHKQTWQPWSAESFRGWPTILALAIPNCISVCLEWWWYELMIIMAGLLANASEAVATMGVLIQFTSFIYIFPSSLSLAVSTRVGNELGSGRPDRARLSSVVSLVCAVCTSVLALATSFTMRNVWATFFVDDDIIKSMVAVAMPVLGLCELGNCPQTTMCGVLRGSARPKLGANINLGSFYGVGLPVAIGLGFFMKMDLMGLWMGLLAAQGACSILMAIMLFKTDWEFEAQRAKELTGGAIYVPAHVDEDEDGEEDENDMKKNIVAENYDVEAQLTTKLSD